MMVARCIAFVGMVLVLGRSNGLAFALKITRVEVEAPVVSGEDVKIRCDWLEGSDTVYSVKWYHGNREFYRWTFTEEKPLKVFPMRGLFSVDPSRSYRGHVLLQNVSLDASAFLRCEVSGEAPKFHTEDGLVYLDVKKLPEGRPHIEGVHPMYQVNQDVMLTCATTGSKPAPDLAFYINDDKANSEWVSLQQNTHHPTTSLESALLRIQFPLQYRMLRNGEVQVKCTAQISDIYYDSSRVRIVADVPRSASSIIDDRSPAAGRPYLTLVQVNLRLFLAFLVLIFIT